MPLTETLPESFTIKGEGDNFLTLKINSIYGFPNETCYWGGYDAQVGIHIKSDGFQVRAFFFTSTGELFSFYEQLKGCNEKLKGSSVYSSYEGNLKFTASYDKSGHVNISGEFSENMSSYNRLQFSFNSDQSFITYALNELELIVTKYGDQTGLRS